MIGHLKSDHRMNRNHLAALRAMPSTPSSPPPGFKFRRFLAWLALWLALLARTPSARDAWFTNDSIQLDQVENPGY